MQYQATISSRYQLCLSSLKLTSHIITLFNIKNVRTPLAGLSYGQTSLYIKHQVMGPGETLTLEMSTERNHEEMQNTLKLTEDLKML